MNVFNAYRNKNFSIFWFTQLISQMGSALYVLVLPLWVYSETGSAISTGVTSFLSLFPTILLSPFSGVIVDKYNPKVSLIICDMIKSILIISLIFINESEQFVFIYFITFIFGVVNSVCLPATDVLMRMIVSKERLSSVNALNTFSWSVSMVIAPVLGGYFLDKFDFDFAFELNSLSYVIGAIGTALLTNIPHIRKNTGIAYFSNIKLGISYLKNSKILISNLVSQFVVFFVIGANGLLFILHLKQSSYTANEIGMFMAAQGVGMIFSSLVLGGKLKNCLYSYRVRILLILGIGISLYLFVFLSSSLLIPSLLCITLFGVCLSLFNIINRTLIQSEAPEGLTGRVSSLFVLQNQLARAMSIISATYLLSLNISSKYVIYIGCTVIMIYLMLNVFYILLIKKEKSTEIVYK